MEDVAVRVVHTNVFGLISQGGNPCPVVFDADKLSSEQMQQLAADFAVETAFILMLMGSGRSDRWISTTIFFVLSTPSGHKKERPL